MSYSESQERVFAEDLHPQEITHLFMERGKFLHVKKGQAVVGLGEKPSQVFYLNDGEVKLVRTSNQGKEIILELLSPGNIFGETEAISNEIWRSTAICKKDCILHYIAREELLHRMSEDPRLSYWLIRRISAKQLRTEDLVENLLFKSAYAKVATVILNLAMSYGVQVEKGLLVDYVITHQEIGNSIATTRETVSYAFMHFRDLGLVDTVKRRTLILDKAGLEKIATESE